MLALFAAATVALSASSAMPAQAPTVVMKPAGGSLLLQSLRAAPLSETARCKAAGRMQTSYEPALLYREQDREAGRMKKLIELPMGEMCLLGGIDQPSVGR